VGLSAKTFLTLLDMFNKNYVLFVLNIYYCNSFCINVNYDLCEICYHYWSFSPWYHFTTNTWLLWL